MITVWLAALPVVWICGLAWQFRDLAMDDAYIGFRYIANLLAGEGFVFNLGARVEGVTNGGWLLVLAPLSALVGTPPLAAKLAAVGALLAACTIAARMAAGLARAEVPAGLLPALIVSSLASHAELVGFSLLGMESAGLALLLLAIVGLGAGGRTAWLPLLGTVAFTFHPEAGLVVPLGCLFAAGLRGVGFGLSALASGVAFALYAPPDWTGFGRYFAPYAPIAFGFLWLGLLDVERRLSRPRFRRWPVGLGTACLLYTSPSPRD